MTTHANDTNNTTPYYEDDWKRYETFKAAMVLGRYATVLVPPFGVLGNLLCITVLLQKSLRRHSSCIYMTVLACADATFLTSFMIHSVGNFHETALLTNWGCKILNYVASFSATFSSLILVVMTFERFIMIALPFKATRFCTPKLALLTSVVLLIFCMLFYIYAFWYIEFISTEQRCGRTRDQDILNAVKVISWFHASFSAFIPSVTLLVLNIIIILTVQSTRRKIRQDATKSDNLSNQLTIMLLAISVTFTVCYIPSGILEIIYSTGIFLQRRHGMNDHYALYVLVFQIFLLMRAVNHSVNFVLYCITGQRFRNCFLALYCGPNWRRVKNITRSTRHKTPKT